MQDPALVSYQLILAGLTVSYQSTTLKRLIECSPGFSDLILFNHNKLFPARFRKHLDRYDECRYTRPCLDERESVLAECKRMTAYRAIHQYLFFIAPIWIRLYANLPYDTFPEHIVEKTRFIHHEHAKGLPSFFTCGTSSVSAVDQVSLLLSMDGNLDDWVYDWVELNGQAAYICAMVA